MQKKRFIIEQDESEELSDFKKILAINKKRLSYGDVDFYNSEGKDFSDIIEITQDGLLFTFDGGLVEYLLFFFPDEFEEGSDSYYDAQMYDYMYAGNFDWYSEFSDRFDNTVCVPNNSSIIIPNSKCIKNKFKCNKFERKINIRNICKKCVNNDEPVEKKRSLLYYPFEDKFNKRFLYIKLESHSTISLGHAKNAFDTYVTKTKFSSDSKTCKSRRERLKDRNVWDTETKYDDKILYNHLLKNKIIDDDDMDIINYYNINNRVGNELFIPYSFIVNNDIFTINS